MKKQSFTLIEAVVVIFIIILLAIAFSPNLVRRSEQAAVDQATTQLVNAVYETKSLAISPTRVTDEGKVMQAWIIILNIADSPRNYCYHVDVGTVSPCPGILGNIDDGLRIPGNSYVILAAEDTHPSLLRTKIKEVKLPNNVSVFFNFPCHGATQPNCPVGPAPEACFWKPHFRHIDGAIGFEGRYYDYPDLLEGFPTGYWITGLWGTEAGNPATRPRYSELVVVGAKYNDTENRFDTQNCIDGRYEGHACKKIQVDNITGAVNVL